MNTELMKEHPFIHEIYIYTNLIIKNKFFIIVLNFKKIYKLNKKILI